MAPPFDRPRGWGASRIARERLGHPAIGVTLSLYSHVIETVQQEAFVKLDSDCRSAITPHRK